MVTDDGDAIFKKLEHDRGEPLSVLTPQVCVRTVVHSTVIRAQLIASSCLVLLRQR